MHDGARVPRPGRSSDPEDESGVQRPILSKRIRRPIRGVRAAEEVARV
jgi:hypothetical protein